MVRNIKEIDNKKEINKKNKTNKIDNIKIGNVIIEKTAALAPMAGVSDLAFRKAAKQNGACYLETEMISAKALCFGDKKTKSLLLIDESQKPIAIQLFGSEPYYMAKAAYLALEYSPDIIDINMGCPVKKITNNNSGAALMKDPVLASQIIKEVVKTVEIPVTVKIRSGWDDNHINAVEFATMAEESGAAALTLHGRTREQFYSKTSSLEIIKKVKDNLSIPVIGNGDVVDLSSAIRLYQTGCDLIMIGRGALGAPWIFKEIKSYFNGENYQKPKLREIVDVMKNQVKLMTDYLPERVAISQAKKHICWYLKGFRNSAIIRGAISKINSLNQLDDILEKYLDFSDEDN